MRTAQHNRPVAVLGLFGALLVTLLLGTGTAFAAFGYVGQFGGYGTSDGRMSGPAAVAVAGDGTVFVADTGNDRIQKFTAAHAYAGQWGAPGSGDGFFGSPWGVAVSGASVYVADTWNERIQVFSTSGVFTAKWSMPDYDTPHGVAVDAAHGYVYASDGDDFNPGILRTTTSGTSPATLTPAGINRPKGLTVAPNGDLLIANTGGGNVKVVPYDGSAVRTIGSPGQGDGQFNAPEGVTRDAAGNVWVADTGNHRIQEFSGSGTFLGKWGTSGNAAGKFYEPTGLAFEPDGDLLVADSGNDRIQVFGQGATPPSNLTPPSITGEAWVNGWLECAPGTWAGDAPQTATYTWLRDGVPGGMGDEYEDSYNPTPADAGHQVVCRVTMTNSPGSASADSAPVTIAATRPSTPAAPVLPPLGSGALGSGAAPTPAADKAGAPSVSLRVYRQAMTSVVKKGVAVVATMDKSGNVKIRLLLDKATQRRLKLKLKGGVVATAQFAAPVGGGGKVVFLKFRGKALAALKKAQKGRKSVKVIVEVSGSDRGKAVAKAVKATYTLKTGASA